MPFNPYIVFGIVKKNGVLQVSVIVTIENLTLGGSDTRTTDNDGFYIYDDLTQLPNSYNSGNEIKVSTIETWTSFFTLSIPEEKEINLYYTSFKPTANGKQIKPTANGKQIKPTANGKQIKPTANGRKQ